MNIRNLITLCISCIIVPVVIAAPVAQKTVPTAVPKKVAPTIDIDASSKAFTRILEIDTTVRTSTGNLRPLQMARGRILISEAKRLTNGLSTWNLIPTTDKTLAYTLTLQKYKLSCEINVLKTILEALGYPHTEDDIIRTLPHYNLPLDSVNNVWGDPDKEFVGLYQGSEKERTGYGIYEGALAAYIGQEFSGSTLKTEAWNRITRPTDVSDRQHLTRLLDTIDQGGHVMLWADWCTDPRYEDGIVSRDRTQIMRAFPLAAKNTCSRLNLDRRFTWQTMEGKIVEALDGDHVFVLLGYIGKKENPSHIIVWDTDTGRHIYPLREWMRKWSLMDNRSLIITK